MSTDYASGRLRYINEGAPHSQTILSDFPTFPDFMRPAASGRLYAFPSVRFSKIGGPRNLSRSAARSRWQCASSQVSELTACNKGVHSGQQEVGPALQHSLQQRAMPGPVERYLLRLGTVMVDAGTQLSGEDRARQSQHEFEIELQAARIEVGGTHVDDVVHDKDLRMHHLWLIFPDRHTASQQARVQVLPGKA